MFNSLRARLIGICIAITTLSLVALALATFFVVRSNTVSGLDERIGQLTRVHAGELAEWVKEKQRVTGSIKGAAGQAEPIPLLQAAKEAGAFDATFLSFADKRHFSTAPPPPGYDGTSRGWYKQAAQAGTAVVTAAYLDAASGKLTVTFAEPVVAGGQVQAVAGSDMFLDTVIRKVAGIHPLPKSYGFLIDGQSNILAHSKPELALKPVTAIAPTLDAALLARLAADGGSADVSIDGADQMLYAAKVEGTPWTLAIAIDRAEATRPVRDLLQVAALITILCVAVAVG
ncbi:cache domain-containing protein, partial [Acidovorax sp. GBBC 3334]